MVYSCTSSSSLDLTTVFRRIIPENISLEAARTTPAEAASKASAARDGSWLGDPQDCYPSG